MLYRLFAAISAPVRMLLRVRVMKILIDEKILKGGKTMSDSLRSKRLFWIAMSIITILVVILSGVISEAQDKEIKRV